MYKKGKNIMLSIKKSKFWSDIEVIQVIIEDVQINQSLRETHSAAGQTTCLMGKMHLVQQHLCDRRNNDNATQKTVLDEGKIDRMRSTILSYKRKHTG